MSPMLSVSKSGVVFALWALLSPLTGANEGPCGAGEFYCSPGQNQCYTKDRYNCIAKPSGTGYALCPIDTCLCGEIACYPTNLYSCDKDFNLQNPPRPQDTSGRCGGGSGGDPLVRGFDGCQWYLNGAAGKVYNLVAGPEDTVNTLLVPANLTDAAHSGNGTFHGTVSFRHLENLVTATVSAEGNLTVTVDGSEQPFDTRFQAGELKGKVVRHMPFFGQYLEVRTPALTYTVQAVQPLDSQTGYQRGHVDLDFTLHKAVPGEGLEQDYIVQELSSIPEARHSDIRVTRRLNEQEATSFPLIAKV